MIISTEDMDKLKIIDRYVSSMTLDEVKLAFGEASTADKIAGAVVEPGPILNMYRSVLSLETYVYQLRAELSALQADMSATIRVLHGMSMAVPPYSQELVNLKSRYSIY